MISVQTVFAGAIVVLEFGVIASLLHAKRILAGAYSRALLYLIAALFLFTLGSISQLLYAYSGETINSYVFLEHVLTLTAFMVFVLPYTTLIKEMKTHK